MKEKIANLEAAIKDILPPVEQDADDYSAQSHNQIIITGGLNLINIGTKKQNVKVNSVGEKEEG